MKRLVTITIVSLLISGHALGQNDTVFIKYNRDRDSEKTVYRTDTVVFDTPNARQILYGTSVLPSTLNQQIAKGYGLYLETVTTTPCSSDLGPGKPQNRNEITSISEKSDSLYIALKYWGNCCHSFLCDVEIIDHTTVNLIVYGYGATYCSCTCCFGLSYSFSTMDGQEYKGLKSVMVNGDKKTLRKLR